MTPGTIWVGVSKRYLYFFFADSEICKLYDDDEKTGICLVYDHEINYTFYHDDVNVHIDVITETIIE